MRRDLGDLERALKKIMCSKIVLVCVSREEQRTKKCDKCIHL